MGNNGFKFSDYVREMLKLMLRREPTDEEILSSGNKYIEAKLVQKANNEKSR